MEITVNPTQKVVSETTGLKVRTNLQAGTTWSYVGGLKTTNAGVYCPMSCPRGWEGTTRNMTTKGGECGCVS